MSETSATEKKSESILIERRKQPMTCWFVNCHSIWSHEIRRHLGLSARPIELKYRSVDSMAEPNYCDSVVRRAFVLLQTSQEIRPEELLGQLQQLLDRQAFVAVVGEIPSDLLPAIRWAGAVAVVTDIGRCDRLAAMLVRAAGSQRESLVGWKHRFQSQIPWPPE